MLGARHDVDVHFDRISNYRGFGVLGPKPQNPKTPQSMQIDIQMSVRDKIQILESFWDDIFDFSGLFSFSLSSAVRDESIGGGFLI